MPSKTFSNHPYPELYIYYLAGCFRPETPFAPKDYIGCWEEDNFSFLFFSQPNLEMVEKTVKKLDGIELLDHYQMSYEQWQGGRIEPCRIASFTITPPWSDIQIHDPQRTIVLDPGVVFGSGTHPTTRDCLAALELALADGTIHSALDLGTGTGLLALAAARLGCSTVLAMDLNRLAVQTARRNVSLNGQNRRILVAQGDAEKFMDFASDLVITNIHYAVMKKLLDCRGFLQKKRFILSGLMRSEAERIASRLDDLPVEVLHRWDQSGTWHTFYGVVV